MARMSLVTRSKDGAGRLQHGERTEWDGRSRRAQHSLMGLQYALAERTSTERFFLKIAVMLRQRKEPNRAECSGEKSDIGRNRSKDGDGDFVGKFDGCCDQCNEVKPDIIQMQLNQ